MVAAVPPPPTVAADALATRTTARARTARRALLRIFMVLRTRGRRGPYRGGSTSTVRGGVACLTADHCTLSSPIPTSMYVLEILSVMYAQLDLVPSVRR